MTLALLCTPSCTFALSKHRDLDASNHMGGPVSFLMFVSTKNPLAWSASCIFPSSGTHHSPSSSSVQLSCNFWYRPFGCCAEREHIFEQTELENVDKIVSLEWISGIWSAHCQPVSNSACPNWVPSSQSHRPYAVASYVATRMSSCQYQYNNSTVVIRLVEELWLLLLLVHGGEGCWSNSDRLSHRLRHSNSGIGVCTLASMPESTRHTSAQASVMSIFAIIFMRPPRRLVLCELVPF